MPSTIDVFVTYSHEDERYLRKGSLLGHLRGLEQEGVRFWTDEEIALGEDWDAVIKQRLQASPIALVLVSQGFLDSRYCQQVEISQLLARKAHLLPVILSPCEWQRHEWLSSRQFLPGGQATIEEDYKDAGKRKRLFLEIRKQLRERVEALREQGQQGQQASEAAAGDDGDVDGNSSGGGKGKQVSAPLTPGRAKLELQRRLGKDWQALADVLEIELHHQRGFQAGSEARAIWEWLEDRRRLAGLEAALVTVGRGELAALLRGLRFPAA